MLGRNGFTHTGTGRTSKFKHQMGLLTPVLEKGLWQRMVLIFWKGFMPTCQCFTIYTCNLALLLTQKLLSCLFCFTESFPLSLCLIKTCFYKIQMQRTSITCTQKCTHTHRDPQSSKAQKLHSFLGHQPGLCNDGNCQYTERWDEVYQADQTKKSEGNRALFDFSSSPAKTIQ